jgi:DNA-binding transcriptional LysR family regulator
MQSPNLDDLRFFNALATAGTLTGAAESLGVSASTVSRRIASLEDAVGARLFQRRPDGYTPTVEAGKLLAEAAALESKARDLFERVGADEKGLTGRVRINLIESLLHAAVLPSLRNFMAAHPGLTLDVSATPELAPLHEREAEITLRLSRPEHGPYRVQKVGRLTFGVYAPRRASSIEEDLRGLLQKPLGWSRESADSLLEALRRKWLPDPPALVMDSVRAHVHAIELGLGVGVLPTLLGDASPALARIDPDAFTETAPIWMICHEDVQNSRRVRAVRDHLAEALQPVRVPTR